MLNTSDVVNWFQSSPAGKQLVAEREAEHFTTRQQLADEREALIGKRDTAVQSALKIETKAKAELDAANAVVAKKLESLRKLQTDRVGVAHRFERQIREVESKLRETCDNKLIDEFLSEVDGRRKTDLVLQSQTAERQTFGGMQLIVTASNQASVERLSNALVDARHKAEALRLSPSRDIAAELDKIRDSLPVIKMEKVGPMRAAVAPA